MDGGDVGHGVDPWLNHPHGARVPWPPYYTIVARMMLGPGAPDDPLERNRWIEHRAAYLPMIFGVLTSLLAAAAAWIFLRPRRGEASSEPRQVNLQIPGAITAGLLHALCNASVFYSPIGNADHHAFVSFLNGAMLLVLAWVLRSGALHDSGKRFGLSPASRWGALAGVFAGILLGAWVGSLMNVIAFQIALACLLFIHTRKPMPGLPAFGFSFHIAAAVVLLPAVFSSPWLAENPWMVVNLSWFHPVFLLIGAAVFAPLYRMPMQVEQAAFRRYPLLVGAALAGLALILAIIPNPIADGIREGYSWLSTTEEFMTNVAESRPLLGDHAEQGALLQYLGYGIFLLPIAWFMAIFSRSAFVLIPWIVAVPLLVFPALSQRRFGDALAMPMAVILAFGLMVCLRPVLAPLQRRLATSLPSKLKITAFAPGLIAAVFIALALQWPATAGAYEATTGRRPGPKLQAKIAAPYGMYHWLREHRNEANPEGVLSNWGQGHAITWAAQMPSVACNFGSYVGVESFQAPSRFFLADAADLASDGGGVASRFAKSAAEQLLVERQVRWVIVPWQLPGMLRHQVAAIDDKALEYFLNPERGALTSAWYQTVGAQLMFDGRPAGSVIGDSLSFLRMVHESPIRMQKSTLGGVSRRIPAGWIWQRVAGAEVLIRGKAGELLQVSLQVQYPGRSQPLLWKASARADTDGVARVRVPYCTDQNNGDGVPSSKLDWKFADQAGAVSIPEAAVQSGSVVEIQPR